MELDKLNDFLGKAALATYAGGGERVQPQRPGFYELKYREGDFYYRDSFAGYLSSHGQEVVWHKDKPVWMCSYAGGMTGSRKDDPAFADETFEFLKKAMRTGEKSKAFQPRGPKEFKDGDWEYKNDWSGGISEFKGHEEISNKGETVFIHDFFGGLLRDGRK
ncbi:MAG: hypothetical protein A2119_01830 [Candidatus Colwellbacteria bacterium GWA2_46_10]|uniref:DUF5680 domain-containing protein n=1 Tax=Candidatus Colwellbacteria bacterium GWA2_46_10 TaxID=1797684 RepID=A0A1G1YX02_9BACT|nr:MAG: Transcriptional regulator [Microgenomates group bacterium GW2011_GWA1_Microgenomates_45_10]KKU18797.1 MAG: Transcriptional regulator [Parcubacteria group bacterium GW2011_GWA2_46_10]OGY56759.1 MAG: hypothetical protein A2119_01830 [Candidatus Colwellbacteria bacterium GWA2_46_10]